VYVPHISWLSDIIKLFKVSVPLASQVPLILLYKVTLVKVAPPVTSALALNVTGLL